MPVVFIQKISREDLVANPDALFLFGDNVERSGFGGQAKEMRGEPNAVGIRTKMAPHNAASAFFSEDPEAVAEQNEMIAEDFEPVFDHLENGGVVVVPADGLGTGLARLRDFAPSTLNFLAEQIARLREY